MERFSVQDEGAKRAAGLRALLFEIGVVAVLVVVIVLVLGYFNVVDISALFPKQKNLDNVNSLSTPTITNDPTTKNNTRNFADRTDEAITSAKTINQYEGIIADITTIDGAEKVQGNIRYRTIINLKGKGKSPSMIYFDDVALNMAKVFEVKDSKEITLSIKDLKIKDEIKVVITRSLNFDTAGYDYTGVEIERIAK